MTKKASNQNLVLWICAIALFISTVALAVGQMKELEQRILSLESEQIELKQEIERQEERNEELRLMLSDREEEIQRLYKPQPVQAPAQFPIARVLARSQDTVTSLAQREETLPEVIFALNPWLHGSDTLVEGQAIWIPSP